MKDSSLINAICIPCPVAKVLIRTVTLCSLLALVSMDVTASSLDDKLRDAAGRLAENTPWIQSRSIAKASHPLGVQTLSIEKQESKRTPATSLVRVFQFHYDLQQARLAIVDTDTSRVVRTQSIESVHLPLNNNEIAQATQLLATNTAIIEQLQAEQSTRGRIPFEKLSELDVKASIFEPLDSGHICHRQRCALLSLFDATRTVFSTEPVVNLQSMDISLLKRQ